MKSMTGFGRCELAEEGVAISLQVSSVNRKNLEVICSLPKDLQRLERPLQDQVRAVASRGRFQFSIDLRLDGAANAALPSDQQIDDALVRLRSVARRHGAEIVVDGPLLVQLAGLIEGDLPEIPDEVAERLLAKACETALQELVAMRAREGAVLKIDLSARIENLNTLVGKIEQLAPSMVGKHRENLLARLEQAGLELDTSDERVLREIALYADRCDISEEITRLQSHFEQFGQLIEKDEAVGRPLEFLLQEVGREINTCGSKSSSIEVSRLVMEIKNELERLREQVANVE